MSSALEHIETRPLSTGPVRALQPAMEATEYSTTAAATQAQAMVQAAYTVAMGRPRDMDGVRQRLLAHCKRKAFAEQALYKKPIGGDLKEGLSVRFAEAARNSMRNIDHSRVTIYDDARTRLVRVMVIDLEANSRESRDVTIPKTIERKYLPRGKVPIGQRVTASGDTLYIFAASDDEVRIAENRLCAYAERDCTLKMLPSDIKEEAMQLCRSTAASGQAGKSISDQRKEIADFFGELGINPEDLALYLGHDLGKCTGHVVADLRLLYRALRDGETTWADVMAQREEQRAEEAANGNGKKSPKPRATKSAATAETLKAKQKAEEPPPQPEPTVAPEPQRAPQQQNATADFLASRRRAPESPGQQGELPTHVEDTHPPRMVPPPRNREPGSDG